MIQGLVASGTAIFLFLIVRDAVAAGPAIAPAPMFGLNVANTGQSTELGPLTKPSIAWKFNFATFSYAPHSLAMGADGLLFTPGMYALKSTNGSIAWHSNSGGRDTSAALDSLGQLYAFENGRIDARVATTGALLWSANTNASDGDPIKIGSDGTGYAATFAGNIYAYTPAGQLKWQVSTGSVQYGEISHIPAIDAASNIYYSGDTGLRSLDAGGQVRWTTSWIPSSSSVVVLAPNGNVVWQRDGLVETRNPATGSLISSFSSTNVLQAMDSSGNLYLSGPGSIQKLSINGDLLWQYNHLYMDWPLTVDAVGNVFGTDQQGNIIGIGANGNELWQVHVTDSYPGAFNTAPVIGPAGDIYVLSLQDETVTALRPVPEPTSLVLVAIGISIMVLRRRSQHRCPHHVKLQPSSQSVRSHPAQGRNRKLPDRLACVRRRWFL